MLVINLSFLDASCNCVYENLLFGSLKFLFDSEDEENRHDEDQNKNLSRSKLSAIDSLLELHVYLLFAAQTDKYMYL